jgi:hypothetical protein
VAFPRHGFGIKQENLPEHWRFPRYVTTGPNHAESAFMEIFSSHFPKLKRLNTGYYQKDPDSSCFVERLGF